MLRAQRFGNWLRDWVAMAVLARWTNRATPEQLIELGADLVQQGISLQSGQEAPRPQVQLVYEDAVEEPQDAPKWVA